MRAVVKWTRSLGFWAIVAGIFGAIGAVFQNDWGVAGCGVVFALLGFGWYKLFDTFVRKLG